MVDLRQKCSFAAKCYGCVTVFQGPDGLIECGENGNLNEEMAKSKSLLVNLQEIFSDKAIEKFNEARGLTY